MIQLPQVTKFLGEFSIAHRIMYHDGKCRTLHGHNYKAFVSAEGIISRESGMIIDFGELKKMKDVLQFYDHRTVLYKADPIGDLLTREGYGDHVVQIDEHPTVEVLARRWLSEMRGAFHGTEYCQILSLKIFETDSSFAEVY